MIEKWKSTADKKGIILIAPHAKGGAWDFKKDSDEMIPALLDDAKKHYVIDPQRTYLFGHSAGGNLVNNAAIIHADLFAAGAIHSGVLHPERFPKSKRKQRKTPIAIINGSNDDLARLQTIKNSAEALAQLGHPTELMIIKGHTHWYYDLAPQINALAWRFMKDLSLQQDVSE